MSGRNYTRSTYGRPPGLLAGFDARLPAPDVPELAYIGEQWAPRSYFISEHAHDIWELYVQVSGESQWQSESGLYTLAPGGLLAVGPGIQHTMHDRPQSKHHFYFAGIDLAPVFERVPDLAPDWQGRSTIFTPHAESLLAPFRLLLREVSTELPYRSAAVRAALDSLVIEASRVSRERESMGLRLLLHPAVARAKDLLDRHPEERWRLSDLARLCDLSANHLVERFTTDVGVSPRQYLLQARVLRAQDMLAHTDCPITQIGLELGFCSGQHFTVSFKKVTGQTPLAYRRQHAPSA